jgi:predicted transcriptional regulator
MEKQIITFRLDADKINALDSLAEALDRDRSYLLNEAVDVYLDVHQWQTEQIKESIKQSDKGNVVDHEEVRKQAARWRQR